LLPIFKETLPVAKFIDELDEGVTEVEEVVTDEVTDPSTVDDSPVRQQRDTEQGQRPGTKKPSLDDNPDFRKWKSEQDKRAAKLEKDLASTYAQRQQEAQRMAWLEQQLESLQTQHLDEPQKLQFENQKLKRTLAAFEQQRQIEEGRARIFQRITARFAPAGVPYEAYADAKDADEAWDMAADYALKNLSPKQAGAARAEKREANQVDLGGGGTVASDDEWEAKAKRLLKKNDAQGYARHILEKRLG
jgi:hypothetical protein